MPRDFFPDSANASEAQTSVRLLTQLPAANAEPSGDPQVVRLRGEFRSLEAQLMALRGVQDPSPSISPVRGSPPSPVSDPQVISPREGTLTAKPVPPPSLPPDRPGLGPLSPML